MKSLSARRAWIEILSAVLTELLILVALRKESVDRNPENPMIRIDEIPSLSARRAWIEMFLSMGLDGRFKVALRKESVDRNLLGRCRDSGFERRSPQGERG